MHRRCLLSLTINISSKEQSGTSPYACQTVPFSKSPSSSRVLGKNLATKRSYKPYTKVRNLTLKQANFCKIASILPYLISVLTKQHLETK